MSALTARSTAVECVCALQDDVRAAAPALPARELREKLFQGREAVEESLQLGFGEQLRLRQSHGVTALGENGEIFAGTRAGQGKSRRVRWS